jgi:hypothetical protein
MSPREEKSLPDTLNPVISVWLSIVNLGGACGVVIFATLGGGGHISVLPEIKAQPDVILRALRILSDSIPLFSGLSVPLDSLGVVLRNATSVFIHQTQIVLSVGIPLLSQILQSN